MSLHIKIQVSLEQDAHEKFANVNMKTSMWMPVELNVGSSHIRVTSVSLSEISFPRSLTDRLQVRSVLISPRLSCQSTDIIPLNDVSDVYNVSTGHELDEFIIRRRQGVTVYFSSPSRERIVKVNEA